MLLIWLGCFCMSSCSSYFGHRLTPEGGWDRVDGHDEVYFEARSVDGLPDGNNTLVIPAGWKSLPTQRGTDGMRELVTPIQLAWLLGEENLPRMHVDSGSGGSDKSTGGAPLWGQVLYKGTDPEEPFGGLKIHEYNAIYEVLKAGQDAYVLAPLERSFTASDLRHGFAVFGAIGPPLKWVRLGELQVKSSESVLAWVSTRTLGALAWGTDVVLLPVGLTAGLAMALAIAPVGGAGLLYMFPCDSNHGGHIPPTPW